ncbi:hypothetical protein CEXT_436071 [Caerostris extrusa]|uniref:Uncharacterized protein n=1 Tax=Caerostris extrusa TaxID=172846 RepID=A0AAV4MQF6_CAEEX|nr:hypothetical protein CEXT_436071 [Caerostris extrusa]
MYKIQLEINSITLRDYLQDTSTWLSTSTGIFKLELTWRRESIFKAKEEAQVEETPGRTKPADDSGFSSSPQIHREIPKTVPFFVSRFHSYGPRKVVRLIKSGPRVIYARAGITEREGPFVPFLAGAASEGDFSALFRRKPAHPIPPGR